MKAFVSQGTQYVKKKLKKKKKYLCKNLSIFNLYLYVYYKKLIIVNNNNSKRINNSISVKK